MARTWQKRLTCHALPDGRAADISSCPAGKPRHRAWDSGARQLTNRQPTNQKTIKAMNQQTKKPTKQQTKKHTKQQERLTRSWLKNRSKIAQKSTKNRTKMDQKSTKNRPKCGSWGFLGRLVGLLEGSWAHLGSKSQQVTKKLARWTPLAPPSWTPNRPKNDYNSFRRPSKKQSFF